MPRLFALATACLALGLAACSSNSAEPQINSIENLASPEGHQYVLARMTGTDHVAFHIAWPSDWAHENGRNPAVPHLGSRLMLAGGAGAMGAAELGERFADLGAEAQLYPTADDVRGTLKVHTSRLGETIEMINAVLTEPSMDEPWLDRIRAQLKGQLSQVRTRSANLGGDAALIAILGDHPLRSFLALDDAADIDAVTRDDLLEWRKEAFATGGAVIAVAGNISPEEAGAAIDAGLAGLPRGEREGGMREVDADLSSRTIVLVRPEAEKSVLTIASQLPPTREDGEVDDLVALHILSGDDRSRLFEAIRTELRASYGFEATPVVHARMLRFFVVTGEVDTERLSQARETMHQAYSALRDGGATEAEVEAARTIFSQHTRRALHDPAVVSLGMAEALLDDLDPARVQTLPDEFDAVTVENVNRRLAEVFPAASDLIEIIVTPDPDAVPSGCTISSPAEVVDCR